MVYWNNSPDDLNELYFHLYQNAFTPNSYCSELNNQNQKEVSYGRYEKQGLGTLVKNLKVDGKLVETILDNTILKVILNEPLKSGDKITINYSVVETHISVSCITVKCKSTNQDGLVTGSALINVKVRL